MIDTAYCFIITKWSFLPISPTCWNWRILRILIVSLMVGGHCFWKSSSAIINSNNQKRISQTRYRKYLISYKSKKQVNGIEINMTIYNQKATETPRRNARGRLLFISFLIMLIKLSCFFHLRVNISERQKCQTLVVIQRVLYIPFALEQKIVVLVKILHPFALE